MQYVQAQDSESTGFDKSKLFIGGNLRLVFGYATIINIARRLDIIFQICLLPESDLIILIIIMIRDITRISRNLSGHEFIWKVIPRSAILSRYSPIKLCLGKWLFSYR
jgi:hypothetical protein